jgi:hypothetical protein
MFLTSSKVKFYFRNVFYTFLGIQGHIICNFWISRIKDMIFQSFQLFLFLKPNSNSDLTEGCHVFCSDWPVPLWVDQEFRPLDLMRSRWARSVYTISLSDLILAI